MSDKEAKLVLNDCIKLGIIEPSSYDLTQRFMDSIQQTSQEINEDLDLVSGAEVSVRDFFLKEGIKTSQKQIDGVVLMVITVMDRRARALGNKGLFEEQKKREVRLG